MNDSGYQEIISWDTLEYYHEPKSSNWFWAVGLISFSAAAAAVILMNFLFAIFAILAGFTVMLYGARAPRPIRCAVTDEGVLIQKKFYPFSQIDSFCVRENIFPPSLILKSQRIFLPYISIPLGETNLKLLKENLSKYLPEKRVEIGVIDAISHHLGI